MDYKEICAKALRCRGLQWWRWRQVNWKEVERDKWSGPHPQRFKIYRWEDMVAGEVSKFVGNADGPVENCPGQHGLVAFCSKPWKLEGIFEMRKEPCTDGSGCLGDPCAKICEERADELTLKIDGERVGRLTHIIREERVDGLFQIKIDDERVERLTCKIREERVDGLLFKINAERADGWSAKTGEERADGWTYQKVAERMLVDGDGSESGGIRWTKTRATSCLRRTQKKFESSSTLGCVRCEKSWLRLAQVTPSTESQECAIRQWEEWMTWVATVASVTVASMASMVAWVASSGGVDGGGFDGVDGVDGGLVASMASNGGVEWW